MVWHGGSPETIRPRDRFEIVVTKIGGNIGIDGNSGKSEEFLKLNGPSETIKVVMKELINEDFEIPTEIDAEIDVEIDSEEICGSISPESVKRYCELFNQQMEAK